MTSVAALASREPYLQHLAPVVDALQAPLLEVQREAQAFDADLWLVASQRDFAALRDRRRVVMEHGVGLEFYNTQHLRGFRAAAAIAAPNEFIAGRFRAHLPRARVEVVGTPKLDALVRNTRGNLPTPICVSFHWSGVKGLSGRMTSLHRYRDALAELAGAVPVLGHAHPRIWQTAERYFLELGIEPVRRFVDVVDRAGVYVCDHSSTLYEWAALGRPVVLLEPGPRAARFTGLRYEHFADIGPHASPAELVDLFPFEDRWAEARQAATDELYPHLGRATQRVVDLLMDL